MCNPKPLEIICHIEQCHLLGFQIKVNCVLVACFVYDNFGIVLSIVWSFGVADCRVNHLNSFGHHSEPTSVIGLENFGN